MRKSVLFSLGLVVAIIVALGLLVLSSAGQTNGLRLYHKAFFFFSRQVFFVCLGVPWAWLLSKFDYHHLRDNTALTYFFYVLIVILLAAALCFPAINGSKRWIPLKVFNLQPSELAKLMSVIIVAMWTDRLRWQIGEFFRGALIPVGFIAVLAGLVIAEPDFGSTMVIVLAGFLTMFLAGTKFLHILALGAASIPVFVVLIMHNANRMARIAAYLKEHFGIAIQTAAEVSSKAVDNAGYQGHHALVALQNGGIFGVGLNESMEKKSYLPEMHTDMIFAIGGEELGLIFSLTLVILWVVFFCLTLNIAKHSTDRFGKLLVIGMSFILFFQTFFNIGVVCGALPMKGMALPFFTYGGTNILCAFTAVGLILSVGRYAYSSGKRIYRRG